MQTQVEVLWSEDIVTRELALQRFQTRAPQGLSANKMPKSEADIILVFGSPRSGTTLINNILCAAPDTNPLIAECAPILILLGSLERLLKHHKSLPDAFYTSRETIFNLGQSALFSLIQDMKHRYKCDKIVIKSPAVSPYVPLMIKLLGKRIRCVGAIRSPEDIIASMMSWAKKSELLGRNHFYEKMTILDFCNYVLQHYNFLLSATDKEMDSIFLCCYESLVQNPSEEIARLARITGLNLENYDPQKEWAKGEIDLSESGRYELAVTPLYNAPISTESVKSATKFMSVAECEQIQERCLIFNKAMCIASTLRDGNTCARFPAIEPISWMRTLRPTEVYADAQRQTAMKKELNTLKKRTKPIP